ncbi:unnamed protein product [Leptosia nina]|uniref:Uncharacterized protein n=1 Tax=Leptosia nina TaxID=320188 RepID=A0AAV1JRB6_9NEOP
MLEVLKAFTPAHLSLNNLGNFRPPKNSPASDQLAGRLNVKGLAEAVCGEDTAMQQITITDNRDFRRPSTGAPRLSASRADRIAVRSLRNDMSTAP